MLLLSWCETQYSVYLWNRDPQTLRALDPSVKSLTVPWIPGYRPVKTEVLYEDPFIVKFIDVYHQSEIKYLKAKAATEMSKLTIDTKWINKGSSNRVFQKKNIFVYHTIRYIQLRRLWR